ncbi:MAG: aldose 1-epimerase, partial [Pseudonocardiales bacterium]|nr:aldose 1-epimerase [Pseudonocardiales bacterium]
LDGTTVLRDGTVARQGDAFCLEPQHFPNSPNEPGFPSTVLRPGERYRSRIVLRFGLVGSEHLHGC